MKKYIIGLVAICSLSLACPADAFAQGSDSRQQGVAAYDKGDYARAVPLLAAAVQQAPQDHTLRVKYAYSLMMVKSYAKSQQEFAYLVAHSKNPKLVAYAQRALQTIAQAHPSGAGAQKASAATPSSQSSNAVAQVQDMLRTLQKQERLADMAPYFSNESAAALGLAFVMFSGFIVSMSGEEGPQAEQQLHTVLQRYHLRPEQDPTTLPQQDMTRLNRQGRQFFKEISTVMDQLTLVRTQLNDNRQAIAQIDMRDISFKQISPTAVEFRHTADKQTIMAVLEEGQWRLHLGDLQELLQKSSQFTQLTL